MTMPTKWWKICQPNNSAEPRKIRHRKITQQQMIRSWTQCCYQHSSTSNNKADWKQKYVSTEKKYIQYIQTNGIVLQCWHCGYELAISWHRRTVRRGCTIRQLGCWWVEIHSRADTTNSSAFMQPFYVNKPSTRITNTLGLVVGFRRTLAQKRVLFTYFTLVYRIGHRWVMYWQVKKIAEIVTFCPN